MLDQWKTLQRLPGGSKKVPEKGGLLSSPSNALNSSKVNIAAKLEQENAMKSQESKIEMYSFTYQGFKRNCRRKRTEIRQQKIELHKSSKL